MYIKSFFKLCLAMSLTYVTLGDEFLPQPYSTNSQKVRGEINEFIVSLLPEQAKLNSEINIQNSQQLNQEHFYSY